MVTHVVATPSAARASAALVHGSYGIALYSKGTLGLPGLGYGLLSDSLKLPSVSIRAWDFLSVALAVFGADRFLLRSKSPDGWTRMIALDVELVDPDPWNAQAIALAAVLRFLTGDIWYLRFRSGGLPPPSSQSLFAQNEVSGNIDCVCLLSGGLDSLIGAGNLLATGHRPFVVSQASPKEKSFQDYLAKKLALDEYHFSARVNERGAAPYEPSSRARSILFIAYGVLVATSLRYDNAEKVRQLFIPENGLIAVNPPLTLRRFGSLSTRTTHPYFLARLEEVLDNAGLKIQLTNPYCGKTKGEMLLECQEERVFSLASSSYSCGKGKRINMHCGRCVPCLIRRAAFHRAGIPDKTPYASANLAYSAFHDDVFAVRLAVSDLTSRNIARWAGDAGPLPEKNRDLHVGAVQRGLIELRDFLSTIAWT